VCRGGMAMVDAKVTAHWNQLNSTHRPSPAVVAVRYLEPTNDIDVFGHWKPV
jgi:hypothetical protein